MIWLIDIVLKLLSSLLRIIDGLFFREFNRKRHLELHVLFKHTQVLYLCKPIYSSTFVEENMAAWLEKAYNVVVAQILFFMCFSSLVIIRRIFLRNIKVSQGAFFPVPWTISQ